MVAATDGPRSEDDANRKIDDGMAGSLLDHIHEEEREEAVIEQAASLAPKLIYEVIRRAGEEELSRPLTSLVYSGIAAGVMISMSVLGEAILRTYLPDTPSRFLVENFGYSLGFLMVIMGRMQLFTENTITTVLPVLSRPCKEIFLKVARLWSLVLVANVIGAFAAAAMVTFTPQIPAEVLPAIGELSHHATSFPPLEAFFRSVPAGFLVAVLVWMLPQAKSSEFFVIVFMTWLIAAGDFLHIIAGSVEMAFLVLTGALGFGGAMGFFIPVLLGNVVGGTVIFTLIAWGQVKDEVEHL